VQTLQLIYFIAGAELIEY